MKLLKKLNLTVREALILVSPVLFNFTIYYLGRLISRNSYHYDLTTSIDLAIPFIPWTVLIYWGCYAYWAVNYYIAVKTGKKNGYRLISSHFVGEIICFLFFIFLPTTMIRATVTGNSLFEQLVKFTYFVDSNDNLFPSIHCFASWICWIGVRNEPTVPKWYRYTSLIIALSICISTLTVKQHVIVDAFAGVLLAELSYLFVGFCQRIKNHE
ncbi:MAG: phosphatidic acid phosphatase [Holdemanella sp.]|nr:phosphatidic acid phosphatase [Holdemanella sp.]